MPHLSYISDVFFLAIIIKQLLLLLWDHTPDMFHFALQGRDQMFINFLFLGICGIIDFNLLSFEASVYMGLFAVAYGKPLFVTSSCQMTAKRLDIDHKNCLHAKAGSSLRADEIVFYDERAMVMNYLVEFSA